MIRINKARKLNTLFGLKKATGITGKHERASCKGCVYLVSLDSATSKYKVCGFCYITGKPRGCPPENCTRKTTKEGRK
jgi:hypothetical protein